MSIVRARGSQELESIGELILSSDRTTSDDPPEFADGRILLLAFSAIVSWWSVVTAVRPTSKLV